MSGPGFLFGPSTQPGWWDTARASCPVVQPDGDGYRMWYYGRERDFPGVDDRDRTALPCGRSGTAWSADGLHWEKQQGRGQLGSVLDPDPRADRFDALQVGVTEVIRVGDEWWCYYVGGRRGTAMSYGEERTGWPTRIGHARSRDGMGFERVEGPEAGAVLAPGAEGAWDSWYVAFPRVQVVPGGFRLTYSAGGPLGRPAVGSAVSSDGIHWERSGQVLTVSDDPEACDGASVGSRSFAAIPGGWLMVYECVDREGNFRLAAATSPDGERWEKLPGRARRGALTDAGPEGSFDDRALGTPYLVTLPDGRIRCYHVGFGYTGAQGIGVLECDGQDLLRWEPVSV